MQRRSRADAQTHNAQMHRRTGAQTHAHADADTHAQTHAAQTYRRADVQTRLSNDSVDILHELVNPCEFPFAKM